MSRRRWYSHPIRAIHYSAPEGKAGRAEIKEEITQEKDEELGNRKAKDRQSTGS